MQSFENITIANPFHKENETWAVCYLGEEGDGNNMLTLDSKRLSVFKKGKRSDYDLADMVQAGKGHKKLLLPLILGGIVSPFSLIAIYENAFSPFLLMAAFFAGIFLLYIGIAGSEVLIIYLAKGKEEYVFMRSIPGNVNRFLFFLNMFLSQTEEYSKRPVFYHQYLPGKDGKPPDFPPGKKDNEGYLLLTPDEYKETSASQHSSGYKTLKINPAKLSAPVRLKNFTDGSTGFITETINPESILESN